MNLSVLPASCRQKKLGSADETSAARCRAARTLRRFMVPMRAQNEWRLSMTEPPHPIPLPHWGRGCPEGGVRGDSCVVHGPNARGRRTVEASHEPQGRASSALRADGCTLSYSAKNGAHAVTRPASSHRFMAPMGVQSWRFRLSMNRVAANVSSLIFRGDQSRLTSIATGVVHGPNACVKGNGGFS
jgi:hypothetical protein